ncbi:MAG: right-handed parallel beta-helix repeat-containing protein [Opitutales bacterium]|nr:right-handed parallel beta-helix repeat-containing protein [Opitutales bacterium]
MKHIPFFFFFVCFLTSLDAQPTGGPYGPVRRHYDTDQINGGIIYVSPDALDTGDGTTIESPITLEEAISKANTGDAIILRGGIYRTGDLKFNQGIILQPYRDEIPVLKGTKTATDWEQLRNGLWRCDWATLFPQSAPEWWYRESSGRVTPPYAFNYDMVFYDGRLLDAVGWEGDLDDHSFYIDYESKQVYLSLDPTGHEVEITAFDNALTRTTEPCNGKTSDRVGPVIQGITFTQYAYRALEVEGTEGHRLTAPENMGKEVIGTRLENVTISYCSRAGCYLRGDDLVVRNCLVSDTGFEGIYVISSGNILLEKNIVTKTNIENIQGVFATAIKIFNQCHNAVCRDNLIIDNPNSSGIWYDVGNVDGLFYNNWIERTDNGFFFEISNGAVCAGNVFVDCGTGIYVLNSRDVKIWNNTLYNSSIKVSRNERTSEGDVFGWHAQTGPDIPERGDHIIANNLLVASAEYTQALVQVLQAQVLHGSVNTPQVAAMGHNVYIDNRESKPLIKWSPYVGIDEDSDSIAFTSLNEFQDNVVEMGQHSLQLKADTKQVFKSIPLHNFELNKTFILSYKPKALPEEIHKLLPWMNDKGSIPGAFPIE